MLFSNTLVGKKSDGVIRDLRSGFEQSFTQSLRKQLSAAGWPASVVQALSVKHGHAGFDIDIPEQVKSSVLDLEYGTRTSSPRGSLRKFRRQLNRGAS
jgi:hypothetical protein